MDIEFDETKRRQNLAKHGLDFSDFPKIFRRKHRIVCDIRRDYGEKRFIVVGLLASRLVVAAYTRRRTAYRVISMRKANSREQAAF